MDEAKERTLKLLEGLDEMLETYDKNRDDDYLHSKICTTLRFINTHLDREEIFKLLDETQLCQAQVIKELLAEPLFNAQ